MAKKLTIGADGLPVEDSVIMHLTHTFAVGGEIKVPVGDVDYIPGFYISIPTGQKATLLSVMPRINAGTSATFKLQSEGVDITGFTSIVADTTPAVVTPTAVELTSLAYIQLVVTAVSGTPKNLTVSLIIKYENT